jgi:hypothetical protein
VNFILNQDFIEFITAFNKQEVEYLLVGGYSVIIHGYNRTTGDLDIWVNKTRGNYQRIADAFSNFGMPLFDMTLNNFLNSSEFDVFTFGRPPVAIDLMTEVKGVNFKKSYQDRIIKNIQGIPINIISRDNLKKAKKASNRAKDQDDLEHLE